MSDELLTDKRQVVVYPCEFRGCFHLFEMTENYLIRITGGNMLF